MRPQHLAPRRLLLVQICNPVEPLALPVLQLPPVDAIGSQEGVRKHRSVGRQPDVQGLHARAEV
eukprot:353435-Chlamydomonas_euryale.AAC.8